MSSIPCHFFIMFFGIETQQQNAIGYTAQVDDLSVVKRDGDRYKMLLILCQLSIWVKTLCK
jgi:hypothetical protein